MDSVLLKILESGRVIRWSDHIPFLVSVFRKDLFKTMKSELELLLLRAIYWKQEQLNGKSVNLVQRQTDFLNKVKTISRQKLFTDQDWFYFLDQMISANLSSDNQNHIQNLIIQFIKITENDYYQFLIKRQNYYGFYVLQKLNIRISDKSLASVKDNNNFVLV